MAVPALLEPIWQKHLPQTRERLQLLEKAANTLADTRTIEPALRSEAREIAHKLAGSLGMFGFDKGSAAARAIELELDQPGLPQPERLQQEVAALRATLARALRESKAVDASA